MYKITKKFENFDGVEQSEDFFFNMTESELIGRASSNHGDFITLMKKVFREKDQGKLLELFEELVLMAYGVKSADGKHFYKSEEIKNDLKSHAAFSDIYIALATNQAEATAFIKGIMPKKYADQINLDMSESEIEKLIES